MQSGRVIGLVGERRFYATIIEVSPIGCRVIRSSWRHVDFGGRPRTAEAAKYLC